jgi:hypothetical protein
MKTRFCQWSVRKMLICTISDTWVVFGDAGLSWESRGRPSPSSRPLNFQQFGTRQGTLQYLGAVSVGRLQVKLAVVA